MSLLNKVKIRVHSAHFVEDMMREPFYFINIRNNFKRRNITVTDVWLFTEHFRPINQNYEVIRWERVVNNKRTLPVIVGPQSEWETWIKVHDMFPSSEKNIMVRLNSGHWITSKKRKGVAPSGIVPGGDNEKKD